MKNVCIFAFVKTITMNKLKLEHIAPYLPYELKGNAYSNEGYFEPIESGELMRIEICNTMLGNLNEIWIVVDDIEVQMDDFKPILRPLSEFEYDHIVQWRRTTQTKKIC